MNDTQQTADDEEQDEESIYERLAGEDWHQLEEPSEPQDHQSSTIGYWDGEPVKAGVSLEERGTPKEPHRVWKTGKWRVHERRVNRAKGRCIEVRVEGGDDD